jgi:hypothetical protein
VTGLFELGAFKAMIGETYSTNTTTDPHKMEILLQAFLGMPQRLSWHGSHCAPRQVPEREGVALSASNGSPRQYHPFITLGGTVLLHSRRWDYLRSTLPGIAEE